jgi:hypothetical protein
MPVSVKNVLIRAQIILQDAGAVRWPLTELVGWLNDALKEVCFLKPSATAETIIVPMAAGTLQSVPEGYSLLIRAVSNISGAGTPPSPHVPGPVITPIVREILDQQKPNWHSNTHVPFRPNVRHVIADIADPNVYYVYPGNDGTGKIRGVFSAIPNEVEVAPGDDVDDLSSYDDLMIPQLQSIYQQCLIDYVLAMAFSKDMQFAGAAERSVAHMAKFTGALGARQSVEVVANVNTTNSQTNS